MGLDDLIMSNHCILVPGDLPKALPWPAQQEQGCHLLCPDFSSVIGMSTLQSSLSGPVPLALYPQTSIKRTCEPGHLSCDELCVPPEQLCDFQQHCAEGKDEEKCGEASQSLPGLVLHGYGAQAGQRRLRCLPEQKTVVAGTTDFESASAGGWEDISIGKLQWQRAEAQESGKPARDTNRNAPGEAHTSPQSPSEEESVNYLSSEGVPCSSHRALPISAEGLGAATI